MYCILTLLVPSTIVFSFLHPRFMKLINQRRFRSIVVVSYNNLSGTTHFSHAVCPIIVDPSDSFMIVGLLTHEIRVCRQPELVGRFCASLGRSRTRK